MLLALLLLFTVLPVLELWLLLALGGAWGVGPTIGLVLVTGVLGAALARWQGFRALWRIRSELTSGRSPTDALLDGALILVAGAVLVTPGVITDAIGFALLAPMTRSGVKQLLRWWFARAVRQGGAHAGFRFTTFGAGPGGVGPGSKGPGSRDRGETPGGEPGRFQRPTGPGDAGRIIDVEVTDVRTRDH